MKKDAIAFCLEENEAVALDSMYYSAKSFKKQIEVLLTLDKEETVDSSKLLYYIVALVEGLIKVKDFVLLSKYIYAILKEESSVLLKEVFQATLEGNEHHLSNYEVLRKTIEKEKTK